MIAPQLVCFDCLALLILILPVWLSYSISGVSEAGKFLIRPWHPPEGGTLKDMMQRTHGFTIVELLIVIVVIAILAALSYVGYTSISNRAHDSAVKSDLANIAKQIRIYHAEEGRYPEGSRVRPSSEAASGSYFSVPGLVVSTTTSSYHLPTAGGAVNLSYCAGVSTDAGGSEFRIFAYSSASGLEPLGKGSGVNETNACIGIGYPRSFAYGYDANTNSWSTWVN